MKFFCEIFLWILKYVNFSILLTLIVFFLFFSNIKIKEKNKMLEYKNKILENNIQEIKKLYQSYIYTYHDIKNHFIVLQEYCKSGKSEKAVQYIEKISKPIHKIKQYVNSGNMALDIILNYKIGEAEKGGIVVDLEIDRMEMLNVEENDLCAIFSNLMDNAIEACYHMDKGRKWIQVTIKRIKDICLIDISNSCDFNNFEENIKCKQSKNGVHGYGMKSIKSKVKKYGGNVKWGYEKEKFIVNITFFNIMRKERIN